MRLRSINVGLPAPVAWRDGIVTTGIFKRPVDVAVQIAGDGVDGDGQADRSVHGGPDKAVYAYSWTHYAWWMAELGRDDLAPGSFGENLTIDGLDETVCHIGDRLAIGPVLLTVTQPRIPCYKLGIRFGDDSMPRRFNAARRPGVYLRIETPGTVSPGDTVDLRRDGGDVSVAAVFDAWHRRDADARVVLERALEIPALSGAWRTQIEKRLRR